MSMATSPSEAAAAVAAGSWPAAEASTGSPLGSGPAAAQRDPEALWLGPEQAPRRLVLLHGWGADADDLLDLGRELVDGLVGAVPVSVVALRAPWPHPAGMGRQWYDLQHPDWPELPEARRRLRERLLALGASVPLEATALLGFSQGGAMALDVGCGDAGGDAGGAEGLPLAALVSCSGYPHPGWLPRRPRPAVLLTHGELDPVVPYAASEAIASLLEQAGGTVRRLSFRGGHGIDPDLFGAIREALEQGWG